MSEELEKKLRSMNISDLKKEISKTNVRGYSKLKKEEVIKFMLKNKKRFMYLLNADKQFIKKGGKTFVIKKKEPKKPEPKKPEPKKEDKDNLNFYKEKFKNLNNTEDIIKLWKSIKNENLKNELLLLPNMNFLISDNKFGKIYDYYKEKLQNLNVDDSIKLWESIKNENLKIQLLQALAIKYIQKCNTNINEYKVALDLLKKKYTWNDLQERGFGSVLHSIYKTKTNFFKRLDNLKNDCLTNKDLDKLGKLKAGGKDIFLNNLKEKRDLEKNKDNENKLKNEYLKLRKKKPEPKSTKVAPEPKPLQSSEPSTKVATNKLTPLSKIKKFENIPFRVYDPKFDPTRGGFERDDKELTFKGELNQEEKRIKLDFFINRGLEKGEPTKVFCRYFKYLLDNNFITDDFKIVLYADASYGKDDNLDKLVKYYEGLSFKKFGEIAFGNQPMETTVKDFIDVCNNRVLSTKKEEPKNLQSSEPSKLDKLKIDLEKLQKELNKLPQPRQAKTADVAEKIIDMRTKLSSKIANIKFDIFEEEGKQKDRDEKDRIKKEKKELSDFKKAVNEFIKKPTEELLEEIDNKFELTDEIPESLLKKLERAIDKFNK